MSFDAAAFGLITLNHLPPFAQRLRHAVHVETRMGRVRRTMDERWARALRAKGIDIDEADGAGGKQAHDGKRHTDITGTGRRPESQPAAGLRGRSNTSTNLPGPKVTARATPFKATGHKGGISRQGN